MRAKGGSGEIERLDEVERRPPNGNDSGEVDAEASLDLAGGGE